MTVQETNSAEREARARGRFIDDLKSKTFLDAIVTAAASEVLELEQAAMAWRDGFLIANSAGVQLDILGRIVGRERTSSDDDIYRLWIRAQIAINLADGLAVDLIKIANAILFEDNPGFTYEEHYPASVTMWLKDETSLDAYTIAFLLHSVRAGGVWFNLVVPVDRNHFKLENDSISSSSVYGLAYNSVTQTYGGKLSHAFHFDDPPRGASAG